MNNQQRTTEVEDVKITVDMIKILKDWQKDPVLLNEFIETINDVVTFISIESEALSINPQKK